MSFWEHLDELRKVLFKSAILVVVFMAAIFSAKDFIFDKIKWIFHPKRMMHNKKLLDSIAREICYELNSNYWSKDISEEMKSRITNPYTGIIYQIIRDTKKKLI